MQLLFDFLPVIAFFLAYKFADIYVATGTIIVATVVQVAIHWSRTRRVNPMHLVSAALVLVFGGMTLLIRDAIFIMWKPTVVYWLFAAAFLASHLPPFKGRTLVQRLMESAEAPLDLPQSVWSRLNFAWVAFFTLVGAANLYVFRHYDENTWVNFKLFGVLGLTLAFLVAQGIWVASRVRSGDGP